MKGQHSEVANEVREGRACYIVSGNHNPLPLDQHDEVKGALYSRLCQEVAQLERRVEALRASSSSTSAIIVDTYQRMIENKRAFMRQWDMERRPPYGA